VTSFLVFFVLWTMLSNVAYVILIFSWISWYFLTDIFADENFFTTKANGEKLI